MANKREPTNRKVHNNSTKTFNGRASGNRALTHLKQGLVSVPNTREEVPPRPTRKRQPATPEGSVKDQNSSESELNEDSILIEDDEGQTDPQRKAPDTSAAPHLNWSTWTTLQCNNCTATVEDEVPTRDPCNTAILKSHSTRREILVTLELLNTCSTAVIPTGCFGEHTLSAETMLWYEPWPQPQPLFRMYNKAAIRLCCFCLVYSTAKNRSDELNAKIIHMLKGKRAVGNPPEDIPAQDKDMWPRDNRGRNSNAPRRTT